MKKNILCVILLLLTLVFYACETNTVENEKVDMNLNYGRYDGDSGIIIIVPDTNDGGGSTNGGKKPKPPVSSGGPG